MKKKVLVAGGAGFIGSNLVQLLLKNGYIVWVVDNFLTSSRRNIAHFEGKANFIFLQGDITDNNSLRAVREIEFDAIFHLASPASPRQYVKRPMETLMANSAGTRNLLEIARLRQKTKFVFASTSEVYGDPLVHPQKEDYWGNVNPVGIRSCYDESKRFGEALCMAYLKQYNTDIRIARIFNTYGPNMEKEDGRVVSNFVTQALWGKEITVYGKGTQTRSFCYVSDMVAGLFKLATYSVKGEVINLGNNQEETILRIAKKIKKITNSDSQIVFKSLPSDDPKRRKPDLQKARRLIEFKINTSLDTGLVKTIDYFKIRFGL